MRAMAQCIDVRLSAVPQQNLFRYLGFRLAEKTRSYCGAGILPAPRAAEKQAGSLHHKGWQPISGVPAQFSHGFFRPAAAQDESSQGSEKLFQLTCRDRL